LFEAEERPCVGMYELPGEAPNNFGTQVLSEKLSELYFYGFVDCQGFWIY
jgi:hypothetical protein